ncbi:hypothetical protein ACFQE0_05530 [Methylobacterium komagatae]|uniref:Peptidoglycan-binding protein n=1 Tax=Methylobacterium komagatae TaxID=374425 RepID=A0ABW2BH61_9HYPH
MISPPAPSARLLADPTASRPGMRLAAFAVGQGAIAFGLVALGFVALFVFALWPDSGEMRSPGAAFRPALTVVAPHTAPVEVPRLVRADWNGTAIAAADGEIAPDPALPMPSAQAVPVPGSVPASFREARLVPPASAPFASPLRPPRAA